MWIPHSSSRERVCVSHTDHRSKHETRDDQVARVVGHVLWIRDTDRPSDAQAHTIYAAPKEGEEF